MKIEFYLQADEGKHGLVVREYYAFTGGGKEFSADGRMRDKVRSCGHVDDAIRKSHEKEYREFVALLNKQGQILQNMAMKAPGTRVFPMEHLPKAVMENLPKDPPAPPAPEVPKLPAAVLEVLDGGKPAVNEVEATEGDEE